MKETTDPFHLQRFIDAQDANNIYQTALKELNNGCKRSHWVWYIFPQLKGLGHSYNATYYGISSIDEAQAYLKNTLLNTRLREACKALTRTNPQNLDHVLGKIDYQKVFSSLTLFDAASPNDYFGEILKCYYNNLRDQNTLHLLQQ